ncbi:hypothetical protein Tdes44962_MAKER05957 [Teratosphaeria destructans]|uniref:Uncharacterized protein n=1 Tax=Teratosphaeria destructans TaxID=418781 RepID=A0A9W7SIP1_9PEZI|nr:hypothetical protein Tdes44962_MAKER05957 [Teratosphaeria destructans]
MLSVPQVLMMSARDVWTTAQVEVEKPETSTIVVSSEKTLSEEERPWTEGFRSRAKLAMDGSGQSVLFPDCKAAGAKA